MRAEPALPILEHPAPEPAAPPGGLIDALGCQAVWIGKCACGYLVELPDDAAVRNLTPNQAAKLGRTERTGYQASRRGGSVKTVLKGDRVILGGQAVIVSRVQFI